MSMIEDWVRPSDDAKTDEPNVALVLYLIAKVSPGRLPTQEEWDRISHIAEQVKCCR